MRTFNVDMIPGGSQTAVACNQYERGDIWVFALYYDGGRYDIPAGATVSITGQKSDGTAFNVPASVSDNTVLVTVTEQMTAAYGKCVAEILVQNGDTVLYTANFYILVEVAAVQVPLADTTLPLSITAQDGTVYVQSDLEEATEQMITLAAQQQYQQDLASGVAQRTVEQYNGSTLAGKKQTVKAAIDELNSTLKTYEITNIVDTVKAVYTGLTADSRIVHVDYGYMCCIIFKIKTTAISSGTVSLPSTIPSCRIETQAALSSVGNHGGFAQLTGRTLVLRCAAETAQYLCGCLVYIP